MQTSKIIARYLATARTMSRVSDAPGASEWCHLADRCEDEVATHPVSIERLVDRYLEFYLANQREMNSAVPETLRGGVFYRPPLWMFLSDIVGAYRTALSDRVGAEVAEHLLERLRITGPRTPEYPLLLGLLAGTGDPAAGRYLDALDEQALEPTVVEEVRLTAEMDRALDPAGEAADTVPDLAALVGKRLDELRRFHKHRAARSGGA
jgi:hypothetical protein